MKKIIVIFFLLFSFHYTNSSDVGSSYLHELDEIPKDPDVISRLKRLITLGREIMEGPSSSGSKMILIEGIIRTIRRTVYNDSVASIKARGSHKDYELFSELGIAFREKPSSREDIEDIITIQVINELDGSDQEWIKAEIHSHYKFVKKSFINFSQVLKKYEEEQSGGCTIL